MAMLNHRVLVVEDDVPTREELTEVLRSLDFDVVGCGDKQTALRHTNEQAFCMALVDLQIFRDPDSIRPMETHGHALIQEIRKKYPERHGPVDWRFPILVVSGFAREGTESKEVIREGASDIVWKLPHGGLATELSRKIQEQLRASGREDHANCGTSSARVPDLELSIPATREKRRTEVRLGGCSVLLPDRLLKILLHLIKGRLSDKHVHNIDMGFNGTGGFKLPAELDESMRKSFPVGINRITKNHYNGYYSLIEAVTIGAIEIDALVAHGDSQVADLARAIELLKSGSNNRNS